MNNQDDRDTLIEEIGRYLPYRAEGCKEQDAKEIISLVLDQAIIMVEDEMYEDNPSFDSLQRKLIDLKDGRRIAEDDGCTMVDFKDE